ncbi:MAG TPA: LptF/LptG family permease [Chryseosolibacter sp.]
MKKLDKLVLTSFLGTLGLTFLVVTFILLNRQLLVYYDDIIGKGLGWSIVGKFIGYFAIFTIPQALPLSILLAALICYGNFAEHFELTAIKSAGISLTRIILPVFVFVVLLSGSAFYFNNMVVPRAALQAFTLLYDIKHTKPALEIREGIFYNGLPDISIKVNQKFEDDPAALKDILLYDHQNENKEVYSADSGRMFTILNDRYLKFELFDGYQYKEDWQKQNAPKEALSQTKFSRIEMVVDLSSFDMGQTDSRNFTSHRYMKNLRQLQHDIDSFQTLSTSDDVHHIRHVALREAQRDDRLNTIATWQITSSPDILMLAEATNKARMVKALLEEKNAFKAEVSRQTIAFQVQWHRIIAYSFACLSMLLIGAPLGAIIRKGGIGVPFLIAIIFFIIFFIFDMQGEKLSNRQVVSPEVGMWSGNAFLLLLGSYFLYQARVDGRLFDTDNYSIVFQRFRARFWR